MTHNPEFQRQLWLNWRPSQLGWSLLLTALLMATPLALVQPGDRLHTLLITGLLGMWIAAAGLGSVLAGRGLNEEARQHTWDWQRLSALTPWQMAWGKLLGAPLPAWLYMLWCALAVLAASAAHPGGLAWGVHAVLQAMLWGLALQAWSMHSVLLGWGPQEQPARRIRFVLVPLLFVMVLPGPLLGRLTEQLWREEGRTVLWWSLPLGGRGAIYLFGAIALGLGLLALWRLLCTRLDVRTLPWAWPLGLCVAGLAFGGMPLDPALAQGPGPASFFAWTTWLALAGTAYVCLHGMDEGLRSWRQVQWCVLQGRWRGALEALPLWLLWPAGGQPVVPGSAQLAALATAQLLRDAALATGFSLLAGRIKSPLAAFAVAWLLANIVLPLLVLGVAGADAAALAQPFVAGLSRPGIPGLWLSLGVQVALALAWLAHVFRQRVLGFAREQHTAVR
jgi:hypothetical protein